MLTGITYMLIWFGPYINHPVSRLGQAVTRIMEMS